MTQITGFPAFDLGSTSGSAHSKTGSIPTINAGEQIVVTADVQGLSAVNPGIGYLIVTVTLN
jgi:hypothetical protein